MKKYDAIIIGSGQAGVPLAKKLAKAGWSTAVIERRWVGGTCINDGCTPTKTMIAAARIAYLTGCSKKWGIEIDHVSVDFPAIINYKKKVVDSFRNSAEKGLKDEENIDLIYGTATFTGSKSLKIFLNNGGTEEVSAEHIFINTGCRPAVPAINGIEKIDFLTSTTILDLDEIPEHLLIIGGGYIGMELGQMFRRFGSKVTILEFSDRLLPKEDEDIALCIKDILLQERIDIYTNARAENIEKNAKKGITVTVNIKGEKKQVHCSHLLVAAGRIPNTDDLGLDKAGVKSEKGFISVNDKLETSVPGIYAMGDVKGGPAFTHISYNDHLIIAKNLLENANVSIKDRLVPYCMFTDPQLGRVGLSEYEARKKGLNIKVAKLPMTHVARAVETNETNGIMKAIVEADTKKILGVAIVGTESGEVMSVLQMAMAGDIEYDKVRDMIFAHPLFSESLNNLFMTLDN